MHGLARAAAAELLGTSLLLAAVVGSGIMGESLSAGNDAMALLANTVATGAALTVLITIFAPVSGAHFNPAVTLVFVIRRELSGQAALVHVASQFAGAVLGVWTAHLMFDEPVFQLSARLRDGPAQGFSEAVATFGLVLTILGTLRARPTFTPAAVGLYITAAYWFTASTSFANPAVTVARALSDTFAGIAPTSAPMFVAAQIVGALVATGTAGWLFRRETAP